MTVKELLSGPEKWTQGSSARDPSGKSWHVEYEHACCWCLWGAIRFCYPNIYQAAQIEERVRQVLLIGSIVDWNDAPERTYEEVMAVVEKAGI